MSLVLQFSVEPRPGDAPFTLDGPFRDTEHFSGFLDAETTEETQFDDPALPRIKLREAIQGLIERN